MADEEGNSGISIGNVKDEQGGKEVGIHWITDEGAGKTYHWETDDQGRQVGDVESFPIGSQLPPEPEEGSR